MSVYKTQRSESSIEYLDNARKLATFTRKCCLKIPKRYTFFGATGLANLADEVYNKSRMANSVYPTTKAEAELRRSFLIQANASLQALIGQLAIMAEILLQSGQCDSWIYNALKEWGELTSKQAVLLFKVKKSDKERYKNLC